MATSSVLASGWMAKMYLWTKITDLSGPGVMGPTTKGQRNSEVEEGLIYKEVKGVRVVGEQGQFDLSSTEVTPGALGALPTPPVSTKRN